VFPTWAVETKSVKLHATNTFYIYVADPRSGALIQAENVRLQRSFIGGHDSYRRFRVSARSRLSTDLWLLSIAILNRPGNPKRLAHSVPTLMLDKFIVFNII
jgi:hypothetical protein